MREQQTNLSHSSWKDKDLGTISDMKNCHRRCTLMPSLKPVTFREHVARRRDVSRDSLLSPNSKEDRVSFLFYIHFQFPCGNAYDAKWCKSVLLSHKSTDRQVKPNCSNVDVDFTF